jgi:eukaryotic-like serine/threonine-protein kinase
MNATCESFVAVLKRSGLVDEGALGQALAEYQAQAGEPSAKGFSRVLIERKLITSWQAEKLLQGKHKGFFLGKYKLLRLLGKGGMSSVYLAEHVLMRRRCAIKVLPWKFVKDSSYLQRFHREAQAVASLDHPNIVRAYDVDQEKDGNLEINFLVMEYVEGSNLYDLVQSEGRLSPVRAADYIRQGALGLEHAHEAGMVHRDVKPGNFLVDPQGVVKLMDLGLARVHEETEDRSVTIEHDERVLGTADYLAPEQAVDSHTVDSRADLYSLGCTFYFLLTGRPPFNEGSLTQRLLAHQTKEPPPIEQFRDDVPESLVAILLKMMAKDRKQRTQTAREAVEELINWLAEHGGDEWNPPDQPFGRSGSDRNLADSARSLTPAGSADKGGTATAVAPAKPKTERKPKPAPAAEEENPLGDFLSSLEQQGTASPSSDSSTKTSGGSPRRSPSPRRAASQPDSGQQTAAAPDSAGREEEQEVSDQGTEPLSRPSTSAPFSPSPAPSPTEREGAAPATAPSTEPVDAASSPVAKERSSVIRTGRRRPVGMDWLKRVKPVPLAAGAVAVLGVIGIIAAFSLGKRDEPQEDPVVQPTPVVEQPPARPPVEGSVAHVGPEGNFASVNEAIRFVEERAMTGSGERIEEIRIAAGQTINETLVVDNSGLGMFPKGLRIVGEGPEFPKLKPPDGDPAIRIDSAEQLTVENLVLDCAGRERAIEIRGYVVRTRLVRLQLEGIEGVGLAGAGVRGLRGQPFIVEECRFESSSPDAVGIRLEASPTADTDQVAIRQCRFLGPQETGLLIAGRATNVGITQCLFHETSQGIRFRGADQELHEIEIVNNTFHAFGRGIAFESGPREASDRMTLMQNLFVAGTGPEVWVSRSDADLKTLTSGAPAPRYNWTDRDAEESDASLDIFANDGRRGEPVTFVSTDPDADAFLKPTTTELRTLVTEPHSPHRFIGAIAP